LVAVSEEGCKMRRRQKAMPLHEALREMLLLAACIDDEWAAAEISDAGHQDVDAEQWRAAKARVMAHWKECDIAVLVGLPLPAR
jgi:hypothetical protein